MPKYYIKKEIEKLVGLVNKNGHHYIDCSDPKLIAKVERLWMIVHQKPYVLTSRIIKLGMARRIVCEMNGKQLNWATYTKWTNAEQFWRAIETNLL
jgi:hypothetical protein